MNPGSFYFFLIEMAMGSSFRRFSTIQLVCSIIHDLHVGGHMLPIAALLPENVSAASSNGKCAAGGVLIPFCEGAFAVFEANPANAVKLGSIIRQGEQGFENVLGMNFDRGANFIIIKPSVKNHGSKIVIPSGATKGER